MKKKLKSREVEVFIDGTDWRYEVGHASDGNHVYPSVKDLQMHSKCWDECGIVRCKLVFVETVVEEMSNKDWISKESAQPKSIAVETTLRLEAAERHLKYLEEKVQMHKDRVILLKTANREKK